MPKLSKNTTIWHAQGSTKEKAIDGPSAVLDDQRPTIDDRRPTWHLCRHHEAVVTDLDTPGFSLRMRGLIAASWSVILRSKALSTFAPSASLLRFSLFSGVGWYRCCCKRLLSSRSKPWVHSFISCRRGSAFVVEEVLVLTVFSDAAKD